MNRDEAYSKASNICAGQEKCIKDISDKLFAWKIDKYTVDDIIRQLCDENYIDESRYAVSYANDKFRFAGWGKRKIFHMLSQKKIPENYILNSINQIDEQEYISKVENILQKKIITINETDSYKIRAKVYRFATSRGFESELTSKILNKILDSE